MVSDTNYEHCLRQKLTLMANAIARIASIKSQLRRSAEKTRKDISNAIDHQLSCIRAREQELLYNLAATVDEKEQKLCEREELLNQAIGACQQRLECLLESNANGNNSEADSMNIMKMLFKMNGLEQKPKESPDLYFEYDPSDLRRDIATFGRVVAIDGQSKLAESLPLDVEHYDEDGALLSHKSVLRLSQNRTTDANGNSKGSNDHYATINNNCLTSNEQSPLSDSIDYWLSHVNLAKCDDEDFEYIRSRIASVSTSSIEVINPASENVDAMDENSTLSIPENMSTDVVPFYAHFLEINAKPLEHWLHRSASDAISLMESGSSTMTISKCSVADATKVINKRKLEELTNSEAHLPEFVEVIRSIQLSDDDQWLLNSRVKRSRNNEIAGLQTSFSEENIFRKTRVLSKKPDEQNEMDCQENRTKKERCSLAELFDSISADNWLFKKPSTGNEDAKSTANDSFVPTLDSMTAWQKVLERIHAMNEDKWLSSSTRTYSKSAR